MRPFTLCIFSPLVCALAFALPTGDNFQPNSPSKTSQQETSDPSAISPHFSEYLSVTVPPKVRSKTKSLQSRPRKSANYLVSTFIKVEQKTSPGLGVNYVWTSPSKQVWQLDLLLDTDLNFLPGISNYVMSYHSKQTYSFWKWGLINKFEAREQLASFLDWQDYLFRLGIGIEKRYSRSQFKIEVEALSSVLLDQFGVMVLTSYVDL